MATENWKKRTKAFLFLRLIFILLTSVTGHDDFILLLLLFNFFNPLALVCLSF